MQSSAQQTLQIAYQTACETELQALKPGNVGHVTDQGSALLDDFIRSARASAVAMAAPNYSVGERILAAVESTREVVGHNTNLGIVLLCAPLAQAYLRWGRPGLQPHRLQQILQALSVEDARLAYRAIRMAQPGGMGEVEQQGIDEDPDVTLLQAMQLAEERDRVAYQYVHGYRDIFDTTLPQLKYFLNKGMNTREALTGVFLSYLARVPDSLISRKHGPLQAQSISDMIAPLAAQYSESAVPGAVFERLMSMDGHLKRLGINPGTTADLMVATLFLALLESVI